MDDVFNELSNKWRTNLQKCMNEQGLTQADLAQKMTEARKDIDNKTVSQQSVSKWLNVGLKYNDKNVRKFPEAETMKSIANALDVDLGYLLGETDHSSFDMEKAVKYTGLEAQAIQNIQYITGDKFTSSSLNHGTEYKEFRAILSEVLASKEFTNFILAAKRLKEAHECMQQLSEIDPFESIRNSMDRELYEQAQDLYYGYDPEDNSLPEPTPELKEAVNLISNAHDEAFNIQLELEERYPVKVARYELNEVFVRWIDSLKL